MIVIKVPIHMRAVLVPPSSVATRQTFHGERLCIRTDDAVDATDEDLKRAGYVSFNKGADAARAEATEAAEEAAEAVLPRATDEELFRIADGVYSDEVHANERDMLTAVALAVAARVRREQCLVTRAVEAGLDVAIVEAHDDAERPGLWYIVRITESGGEETEATVPAADVPATLARLLGEVTRG